MNKLFVILIHLFSLLILSTSCSKSKFNMEYSKEFLEELKQKNKGETPKITVVSVNNHSNSLVSEIGTSLSIKWIDSDDDSDAKISIFLKDNNSGPCSQGTLLISDISENDKNDSYSFNSSGVKDGSYYFCLKIEDEKNNTTESNSSKIMFYQRDVCSWHGSVDDDWFNQLNWIGCTGGIPNSATPIIVLEGADQMPLINSNIDIDSFAPGRGGGTIYMSGVSTLKLRSTSANIGSKITIDGDSACTNCLFTGDGLNNMYIYNQATLEIKNKVKINVGYSNNIYVGLGNSPGHLKSSSQYLQTEYWPNFVGHSNSRIIIDGYDTDQMSSIEFDRVMINDVTWCCGTDGRIIFQDHYEIKQFDNVHFFANQGHYVDSTLKFYSCETAEFTDKNWDGLRFYNGREKNDSINASNCSGVRPGIVTISEDLVHNGEYLEDDPNDVFNWSQTSTISYNCKFTNDGGDNQWYNPQNWSECNDRSGIPDIRDYVYIPLNEKVKLSLPASIQGFDGGDGGGVVELRPGSQLLLANQEANQVKSDINIKSSDPVCTTCQIWAAKDLYILNSYLSLYDGVVLRLYYTRNLYVGRSDDIGGEFKTDVLKSGSAPQITKYGENMYNFGKIIVSGTQLLYSKININGLRINDGYFNNTLIEFNDYFQIDNFNGFNFSSSRDQNISPLIKFNDCTHSIFYSKNWSNFSINANFTSNYNLDFSGNNCLGNGLITIFGEGLGFSDIFANDPGADINWQANTL